MSNSPEAATRRLVVHTGYPTAEVSVLDGRGAVVARAVENLDVELPCGLYQLRYRTGQDIKQEFLELPPGEAGFVHPAPPLGRVSPPVPLGFGPEAFAAPEPAPGVEAGQLLLEFAFRSTGASGVAQRLSLRTFAGQELLSLPRESLSPGPEGASMDLAPGCYLLRRHGEPAIEQSVYVSQGWRTHVIVPIRDGVSVMTDSSVFMTTVGDNPSVDQCDVADSARQRLSIEGSADSEIGEAAVKSMLGSKSANPMLGIFGAHLMLRNPKPDLGLIEQAAKQLREWIGDHPDVRSLFLFLDSAGAGPIAFPEPPMLRSSWRIIVEHGSVPGLVPVPSYAASVGGSLWGQGPWLAWKAPAEAIPAGALAAGPVDYSQIAQAVVARGLGRAPENLSSPERALYNYLLRASAASQHTAALAKNITLELDSRRKLSFVWPAIRYFASSGIEKATRSMTAQALDSSSLANALGIPASVLDSAAASLAAKLGLQTGSWSSRLGRMLKT